MSRNDLITLASIGVTIWIAVMMAWLGTKYRWGYLKCIFFIWPVLGLMLGIYLFLVGASLRTILLYTAGFFLLALVYLAVALVVGTAVGKFIRKLLGLD